MSYGPLSSQEFATTNAASIPSAPTIISETNVGGGDGMVDVVVRVVQASPAINRLTLFYSITTMAPYTIDDLFSMSALQYPRKSTVITAADVKVVAMTITTPGTGYQVGEVLTFTGGTPTTAATGTVASVNGGGGITGVTFTGGAGYASAPTVGVTTIGGVNAVIVATVAIEHTFSLTGLATATEHFYRAAAAN